MSGVYIILSIPVQWQSIAEFCIYYNKTKHNIARSLRVLPKWILTFTDS